MRVSGNKMFVQSADNDALTCRATAHQGQPLITIIAPIYIFPFLSSIYLFLF